MPWCNEIAAEYGVHDTSETGTPITYGRVSQAYDLLNNLTLDAKLSTYGDNEHNLAEQHTEAFKAGDLILCDRNYASFWMFALLMHKGVDFCFRLKLGSWKIARQLAASGDNEIMAEIRPSKMSAVKCRALGLSPAPIKLRFVCIQLSTGEKEVLITTLTDDVRYPPL